MEKNKRMKGKEVNPGKTRQGMKEEKRREEGGVEERERERDEGKRGSDMTERFRVGEVVLDLSVLWRWHLTVRLFYLSFLSYDPILSTLLYSIFCSL